MALIRHCDICDTSIKDKYIKLNAKEYSAPRETLEYSAPRETLHKGALLNYDICKQCYENISRIINNYIRQEAIKRVVD